jgi:hypothetical protein
MTLPTRIVDAKKREEISRYLSKSDARQKIFNCVYRGGNQPKSAEHIAERTKLTRIRVLQLSTPMAHEGYIVEQKANGRKAFSKQKDLVAHRDSILRLAKNKARLEALTEARGGKVNITVSMKAPKQIRVDHITVDSIDNFARVRLISAPKTHGVTPKRLRESVFKYGIAHILGDQGVFTDWGGEKNDLYTDQLTIGGKRYRAAIALKGVATAPPLTIDKLGKRANQIPRLFSSAAEVFIIQFEGQISEDVIEQMQIYAANKSKETGKLIRFGVIGAEDSIRLRAAYPKSFIPKS